MVVVVIEYGLKMFWVLMCHICRYLANKSGHDSAIAGRLACLHENRSIARSWTISTGLCFVLSHYFDKGDVMINGASMFSRKEYRVSGLEMLRTSFT